MVNKYGQDRCDHTECKNEDRRSYIAKNGYVVVGVKAGEEEEDSDDDWDQDFWAHIMRLGPAANGNKATPITTLDETTSNQGEWERVCGKNQAIVGWGRDIVGADNDVNYWYKCKEYPGVFISPFNLDASLEERDYVNRWKDTFSWVS